VRDGDFLPIDITFSAGKFDEIPGIQGSRVRLIAKRLDILESGS
jgi:hypothetical protein